MRRSVKVSKRSANSGSTTQPIIPQLPSDENSPEYSRQKSLMTEQVDSSSKPQFLSFGLSSKTQAIIPMELLTEVVNLNLSKVVPIPDTAPSILGVSNWRGEVLWILDIGSFLGFEAIYAKNFMLDQVSVIVVNRQEQVLGLVVEKLQGIISCHPEEIQSPEGFSGKPELTHYLKGYWSDSSHNVVLLLDDQILFESLRSRGKVDKSGARKKR